MLSRYFNVIFLSLCQYFLGFNLGPQVLTNFRLEISPHNSSICLSVLLLNVFEHLLFVDMLSLFQFLLLYDFVNLCFLHTFSEPVRNQLRLLGLLDSFKFPNGMSIFELLHIFHLVMSDLGYLNGRILYPFFALL